MTATYIVGDVGDVLATIPDDSIDLVMTSPPFLALRSYLPADHPHKDREIGSEPDPATFLDTLLALTAEWRRVLAPHGSLCVELGDTYAGGGQGPDANHPGSERPVAATKGQGWPLAKSLCGIPHLYHLSLAYGRNLLTGEPSPAGRWLVRNVVAWCRPNPPVGALGDKFRPATSYLTIATPNPKRYFDLDAVRTPHKADPTKYTGNGYTKGNPSGDGEDNAMPGNPAGAPPLDYWVIPTAPYRGSHYATFPPALVEKPIQSMVPQRVCRTCGEPSRRIVDVQGLAGVDILGKSNNRDVGLQGPRSPMPDITRETVGWTECGCGDGCTPTTWTTTTLLVFQIQIDGEWIDLDLDPDEEPPECCKTRTKKKRTRVIADAGKCDGTHWRTGIVLDPFAGSGTTLMVASGHGRDSIGIDIDERNADLALERVGPLLLTVEHLADRVTP